MSTVDFNKSMNQMGASPQMYGQNFFFLLSLRLCSARTVYPEQVSPAGNPVRRKAHTRRRPLTDTTGTPSKDHFVKANNSSRWKHRVNSAVAPARSFSSGFYSSPRMDRRYRAISASALVTTDSRKGEYPRWSDTVAALRDINVFFYSLSVKPRCISLPQSCGKHVGENETWEVSG